MSEDSATGIDALWSNRDIVEKRWGGYEVITEKPGWKIKYLFIKPNSRLSDQRHFYRSEHWFILQGELDIEKDKHKVVVVKGKTQKGIDFRGRKFAPYSEGYLKKLQREGKRTNVDLFYTGRMLGALTPSSRTIRKTGRGKVSVGFSNSQMRQRALFNQVLNVLIHDKKFQHCLLLYYL